MASPTPAPERHQWTDEFKRAIFAEFDALPSDKSGARAQWLKDRKIAPAHFYRMRKEFQGSKPAPKKAIKGRRKISPAGLQAIKEAQRRRWAVAKAAGTGKYTTMTGKTSKASKGAPAESKAVVPYNHGQKILTEKLPAIIAEYETIQGKNGAKQKWLDKHGLNYSNIHDMKKRLVYKQQQPAPAAQPQFIPTATPGPVITLDDAIAALQVRQDIWQEFMGLLKAMARGSR
jgi:hypothetical protein